MNYEVLKNDRVGYGYRDLNLRCTNCGNVTTRYIKIDNIDIVTDMLAPTILCSTCLDRFIREMAKSLLEDVKGKN